MVYNDIVMTAELAKRADYYAFTSSEEEAAIIDDQKNLMSSSMVSVGQMLTIVPPNQSSFSLAEKAGFWKLNNWGSCI